jgi:hypothetical protein
MRGHITLAPSVLQIGRPWPTSWTPARTRDSITLQSVRILTLPGWNVPREPHKHLVTLTAGLKVWKPTSPGQRHRITVDRYNLYKGRPWMSLVHGLRKKAGRNNTGRITVWHQGGGHKRLYRRVDFWRADEAESVVQRIEYDPNRSARIALVKRRLSAEELKRGAVPECRAGRGNSVPAFMCS